jgi:hypothetical protein
MTFWFWVWFWFDLVVAVGGGCEVVELVAVLPGVRIDSVRWC